MCMHYKFELLESLKCFKTNCLINSKINCNSKQKYKTETVCILAYQVELFVYTCTFIDIVNDSDIEGLDFDVRTPRNIFSIIPLKNSSSAEEFWNENLGSQ